MILTKKRTIIIILVILGALFFPKIIATCYGERLCFGYVYTSIEKETWLNVKDSVFEVRDKKVETCIGPELQYMFIFDGCPGSWRWFNERPVDCDGSQLEICYTDCDPTKECVTNCEYCNNPDKFLRSTYGVRCSEWVRVCEEIKTKDRVHIDIENISLTGVIIGAS